MYNLYGQFGGGLYNGGMYGNSMYRGGYGGLYGSGMYGGGIYNRGLGGPMGGPYGAQDPNGPPSPPGFWMSVLRVVSIRVALTVCSFVFEDLTTNCVICN